MFLCDLPTYAALKVSKIPIEGKALVANSDISEIYMYSTSPKMQSRSKLRAGFWTNTALWNRLNVIVNFELCGALLSKLQSQPGRRKCKSSLLNYFPLTATILCYQCKQILCDVSLRLLKKQLLKFNTNADHILGILPWKNSFSLMNFQQLPPTHLFLKENDFLTTRWEWCNMYAALFSMRAGEELTETDTDKKLPD